jgi:type IV pilus assembly protein PilZ
MPELKLEYTIRDPLELNLSFMPFIKDGGLFVPTEEKYNLGDYVVIDLMLPGKNNPLVIEGKVIWLTPRNALHHVLAGIGIQFVGKDATTIRAQVEMNLDPSVEIGGYTYGMVGDSR